MMPQQKPRSSERDGAALGRVSGTEPVIEFEKVSKCFHGHLGIGRTPAVIDLDLRVLRGQSFGLLGPNGAGKTTTLKLLLDLLRADSGAVRLLGRPPSDPAARASVGYLPENPYFYDYLTAEEFLDFYGRLRGLPPGPRRERVAETLERVGLADRARTPLRKFSKGMIQRLGLAQAIQHDPEVVILDEPMSGLDPIGRREVRDMILALREAGKTVFFSSHILQDAELVCDRVAILRSGRLRSAGRLEDLVASRVRWIEVSVRGRLPEGCPGELLSRDGEVSLLRVPDEEALAYLVARLPMSDARLLAAWPRRDSLEDLFLQEMREEEEEDA